MKIFVIYHTKPSLIYRQKIIRYNDLVNKIQFFFFNLKPIKLDLITREKNKKKSKRKNVRLRKH